MPALAHVLPIVCPLLFLAGFADSIAGGGGTISVPSALLAMHLSEKYLSYCLMVLLPAAALFLSLNKGFGQTPRQRSLSRFWQALYACLIGLGVGAYDGFFGPGAGTFYIILFCTVLGADLVQASGNAKVVNLASNTGALVTYILGGKVWFAAGLPMAVCAIAGNLLGSRLAIKNGARFIRPIMAIMILLMLVKLILDVF